MHYYLTSFLIIYVNLLNLYITFLYVQNLLQRAFIFSIIILNIINEIYLIYLFIITRCRKQIHYLHSYLFGVFVYLVLIVLNNNLQLSNNYYLLIINYVFTAIFYIFLIYLVVNFIETETLRRVIPVDATNTLLEGAFIIKEVNDDENCSICLELLSLQTTCTTVKCNHSFHLICLLEWNKKNCPICRGAL